MKIKLLKKKETFRKKNLEIDASFYWKIILYTGFLLMILSALFGWYIFSQVNKDPDTLTNITLGQVGTVNKNRIDKDLEYFSQRSINSQDILNSPSPVVDPSF